MRNEMSPTHIYPNMCTICLEELPQNKVPVDKTSLEVADLEVIQPDDQTPIQIKCQHVFHACCIQGWLHTFKDKTSVPSCPICRTSLMDPFIRPLQSEDFELYGMTYVVLITSLVLFAFHLMHALHMTQNA
jgi:hypothetical protein